MRTVNKYKCDNISPMMATVRIPRTIKENHPIGDSFFSSFFFERPLDQVSSMKLARYLLLHFSMVYSSVLL